MSLFFRRRAITTRHWLWPVRVAMKSWCRCSLRVAPTLSTGTKRVGLLSDSSTCTLNLQNLSYQIDFSIYRLHSFDPGCHSGSRRCCWDPSGQRRRHRGSVWKDQRHPSLPGMLRRQTRGVYTNPKTFLASEVQICVKPKRVLPYGLSEY